MYIPVHCPWLPGYMDVGQIILIILTMVGLFPDRLHIYVCEVNETHNEIKLNHKKDEILLFSTTWVELEDIMLR